MSKNSTTLAAFTEYCREHPEERFWQALRNWSPYDFIWGHDRKCTAGSPRKIMENYPCIEDTFYKN